MAEAAVESPSAAGRFFCHKCTQEINHVVLPDYVCPRCQSGFIEEVQQSASGAHNLLDDESANENQANLEFLGILDGIGSDVANLPHAIAQQNQGGHPRMTVRTSSLDRNLIAPWEGIVQQIVTNLTGGAGNAGFPIFLNLHANLGDYAWGRGGFDAIITQLLNQLDCTGPPPLAKEKINKIPTTKITQEQVDKVLQCTVCMEDFKFEESVSKLPCQHHFHNDCIVPWLQLHGTCPICRKLLNDDIGDGPSSNNPSSSSSSTSINSRVNSSTSHSSNSSSSIFDFNEELE